MHTKKLTDAEERIARLTLSMATIRLAHGTCEDGRVKDIAFCSCYWRTVFIEHHGEPPADNDDPRWEALFARGFRIIRMIDGSRP